MRNDIECAPDQVFSVRTPILKTTKYTFGLSFVSCTRKQEDAHQNQERNHREISPNDYFQQHTKTWDGQRMSWPGS
jgi:hypothetical protein